MEIPGSEELDVIVVGAGNAATCAALSARENGAQVLMLEIAPEEHQNFAPVIAMCLLLPKALADLAFTCLVSLARPRGVEPLTPRSVVRDAALIPKSP
jgi:2-polyprenyl-6-methoxyphenol hydroxylase-like FAD-dependent oxidoreductase